MGSRLELVKEPAERRYVARAQLIGACAYAALLAATTLYVAHASLGDGGDARAVTAGRTASTAVARHAVAATGIAGEAAAPRTRTPGGPSSESETHP
jgi:hypothetical protein